MTPSTRSSARRRRGLRRGSRRSLRRRQRSWPPGPASSAAARRRRGPSTPLPPPSRSAARSGRCDGRRVQHAAEQVDDDGKHDDEQDDVPDPPEGHRGLRSATIGGLAAIPGSAPRMTSNWALIALTAPSSGRRCSDSTPCSAEPSVASPCGDPDEALRARRSARPRARARRRRPARPSGGPGGACRSCRAEPVGERVHVAVLDHRFVDDQRQHRRRRLELRDVRRVRGDLARDLQQAVDRLLDAPDRSARSTSSRIATTTAAAAPMPSATAQYPLEVRATITSRPPPSAGSGRRAGSSPRSR